MRVGSILLGVCLLVASAPGNAATRKVMLRSVVGDLDLATIQPMLQRGEVSLVESYRSGRLRQVTVIGLIAAKPDRVWQVLTDYSHYKEFMPNLAQCVVTSVAGNDLVIAYELEVPGSNMEYRLRHRHLPRRRIDITLVDDEGDIETGAWRWELVPHQGGAQTVLVYTLYTDVREASWFVRQALDAMPSLEHGMNVATGIVTIQAIKKRAEQKESR